MRKWLRTSSSPALRPPLFFAEIGKDEDQRNYEVSYAKIRSKGFKTEVDMETGIEELVKAADLLVQHNEFSNV